LKKQIKLQDKSNYSANEIEN